MGQAKLSPWVPVLQEGGSAGCPGGFARGREAAGAGAGGDTQSPGLELRNATGRRRKPRGATEHRGSTAAKGDRAGWDQAAAATARAELPRGAAEPAVMLTLAPAGLLGLSQQQRLCKQQAG